MKSVQLRPQGQIGPLVMNRCNLCWHIAKIFPSLKLTLRGAKLGNSINPEHTGVLSTLYIYPNCIGTMSALTFFLVNIPSIFILFYFRINLENFLNTHKVPLNFVIFTIDA